MNSAASFKLKLFALSFGLLITVILWCLAEFVLALSGINDCHAETIYPDHYFQRDPYKIMEFQPGKHRIQMHHKKSGEVIYDVTVTVNEHGRRHVPVTQPEGREQFSLFFGGSFTMGEGVEDNETLPYFMGELLPTHQPYNFGFHGNGPFDVLAIAETADLKDEIKEPSGIAIYTLIDAHIGRVTGAVRTARWHSYRMYYEDTPDGTFKRIGKVSDAKPVRTFIYQMLDNSQVCRALHIDLPLRTTNAHIERTARAIKQVKETLQKTYPNIQFYVLIYPSTKTAPRFIPHFEKWNIDYLDYSQMFSRTDPTYTFDVEDRHPNAHAYKTVAKALARDLTA